MNEKALSIANNRKISLQITLTVLNTLRINQFNSIYNGRLYSFSDCISLNFPFTFAFTLLLLHFTFFYFF